jgi:lon-related putative ATP-dependent protease
MTAQCWEVPPQELRVHLDSERLPFETTEELPALESVTGQARAMRALDFGLQIRGQGYHLYVAGEPGTGRASIVKASIARLAEGQPTPQDWCYVYNFRDPDRPQALPLPAGQAREFQRDMEHWVASVRRDLAQLNHHLVQSITEPPLERLREKYQTLAKVLAYLQDVHQDILEHGHAFLDALEPEPLSQIPGTEREPIRQFMTRYRVNVVIDNGRARGAPVVEEADPTYGRLLGRLERETRFGTLSTDFTLIKAGALLQANGGYLVLNAPDVLKDPYAWDALKHALKGRTVRIADPCERDGVMASVGIQPEPIPLQVRVVLVGSPLLYSLLQSTDEDFGEIFKVKVEFDIQQNRTEEASLQYSRFIAGLCREEGLLHFDRGAVAAVLEQASRWAEHQQKLSLRFGDLADLIREASYWACQEGQRYVARAHVHTAVAEQHARSNLLEERLRELIAEGTLLVDVAGAVVGQVNGLPLLDLGDASCSIPSRITARVFLGEGGIIDIEREVELSEETHSKGVLILGGYLGGRYAHDVPLSLSATICFEQTYAEIQGDSAAAAELVALLSGLAELPIRQGIAMTGSVNQRGELQPIGGVNEKIEGFYAVCKTLGLTGEQGVIIPRQNIRHLMLQEEVTEAVAAGQFHVYAVSSIDEAIEILTGHPAGELQPDGTYPAESVNARVLQRLQEMAGRLSALERPGHKPTVEHARELRPMEDGEVSPRGQGGSHPPLASQ